MHEDRARFDLEALSARVAGDAGAPEFPALAEALRRSGEAERAREVAQAGLRSAPSRLAGRVALALAHMDLGAPDVGRAHLENVLDEMLEPYRLEPEPEAPLTPVEAETEEPARPGQDFGAAGDDFGAVGDGEIDAAFDQAEARAEEMHSPNRMAETILDAEAPFEAEAERSFAGGAFGAPVEDDAALQADTDDDDDALAVAATDDDDDDLAVAADADDDAEEGFDVAASGAFATRTMAGLLERQGDHHRAESIRTALGRPASGGDTAADPQSAFARPAGDGVDAARAIEAPAPIATTPDPESPHRARVLATLERWLHNVQRGAA